MQKTREAVAMEGGRKKSTPAPISRLCTIKAKPRRYRACALRQPEAPYLLAAASPPQCACAPVRRSSIAHYLAAPASRPLRPG